MSTRYVRSTTGNNSNNGSTWALAKADIANGLSSAGTNGVVYVSQAHAESKSTDQSWSFGTGTGSVYRLFGSNDSAEPPTTTSTAATATTTGGANISVQGHGYVYGLTLFCNGNLEHCSAGNDNVQQVWDTCSFQMTSASGVLINVNAAASCTTTWNNCTVKFAATLQAIDLFGGLFHWNGGSVLSGGTATTRLLTGGTSYAIALIENVDLSNLDAATDLSIYPQGLFRFRNCKLPSGWTGQPSANDANFLAPGRIELWNCDSGNTNYHLWIRDHYGTILHETTHVRTGGSAADGVSVAWKMTGGTRCRSYLNTLDSPPIVKKILPGDVGFLKTGSIEILYDDTFDVTNLQIFVEVTYGVSATTPLGSSASSVVSNFLPNTSGVAVPTSNASWNTTGFTNTKKCKLSVSFTPQQSGYAFFTVKVCSNFASIYVDPKVDIS